MLEICSSGARWAVDGGNPAPPKMGKYDRNIGKHGKTWENMGNMGKYGKLWENMGNYGKIWENMGKYWMVERAILQSHRHFLDEEILHVLSLGF